MATIATSQEVDTDLVFPEDRLNAWIEYIERVPLKFGMHRDCRPQGNRDSFYASRHGLLGVMATKSYRLEEIQNSRYRASVRVNPNGTCSLENVSDTLDDPKVVNLFHNVSALASGLFIPNLIVEGHLKLVNESSKGKTIRYDFVPNGGEILKEVVGVSLEFDSEYDLPVMAEHRFVVEKRQVFQRAILSGFRQFNGEWLPTKLGGGIGDNSGYSREVSCELSYEPAEDLGADRFCLSYYGIDEPELAKFDDQPSRLWLWILISFCLLGLILGFKYMRQPEHR
jgi:hypothetical protein